MREIKIRGPEGSSEHLARLALEAGIDEATSHPVRVLGTPGEAEEFHRGMARNGDLCDLPD